MDILTFADGLVSSTIRMSTVLLIVAIGELYSERAGMLNIGLDGIMAIGTIGGFIGTYAFGNPWIGLLCGLLSGLLFNLIYAFCTITLRAGQIINGMALNILGPAISAFVYREYFGITDSLVKVKNIQDVNIKGLSQIPLIGPLFSASPMTYITILLLLATWFFFYRTKPGLCYMAVGEYPQAAETMGINVIKTKYIACLMCGGLAGLGGAFLTTCYMSTFAEGMVSGRGFIAMAAVISGGWTPKGILLATLLFGFADAVQLRLQVLVNMPYQILAMLPYLFTFAVLVITKNKNPGPKSNGQEYYRESF